MFHQMGTKDSLVPLFGFLQMIEDIGLDDLQIFLAGFFHIFLVTIDACPEDVFNRILWHAVKGSSVPYPAWAVRTRSDDDD